MLSQVVGALRERHDLDFEHYKPTTLVRRIQRRMSELRVRDAREYVSRVRDDALEAAALYRDLLIGVTRFHRDPAAVEKFAALVVPRLLSRAGAGPLRLWVAGCSTGEEAYTIAGLMREALEQARVDLDFRIFATDVDSAALAAASAGEFPLDAAETLPASTFEKYFTIKGDYFVANSTLRDHILFSRHNVIEDPAFSRLDLISCRNLLIYLKQPIQERVLRVFAGALNEEGLLWLGSSETIGNLDDQFVTLDSRWRLYAGRPGRSRKVIVPISRPPGYAGRPTTPPGRDRLMRLIESTVMDYAPPTLVVDASYRLVYRFGDLSKLLRVPMGEASLDVRGMLPSDVAAVLGTTLSRVRGTEEGSIVYRSIHTKLVGDNVPQRFDLRARLIRGDAPEGDLLALSFEGLQASTIEAVELEGEQVAGEVEAQLRETRRDLADARATLQSTIEELESSNEELQSTNEELIASNEELQSTNEELQSVNEELRTVNSEHQAKVGELTALTREMDDLLSAIDFGVILLDKNLTLSRFNAFAARFVNLLPQDVGRPFAHLTHSMDFPDLSKSLAEVANGGPSLARQVSSTDGRLLHVKLRPRVEAGTLRGLVVTIGDITEFHAAQVEATQLHQAMQRAGLAACVIDEDGRIIGFNEAYSDVLGRDPNHLAGTWLADLYTGADAALVKKACFRGVAGQDWQGILRSSRPNGDFVWEVVDLVPNAPLQGKSSTMLWLSRDLTDVLPQRGALDGRERARQEFWHWDPETDVCHYSPGLPALWNLEPNAVSPVRAIQALTDPGPLALATERALRESRASSVTVTFPSAQGPRDVDISMQPMRSSDGTLVLVGDASPVTKRS